MAFTKKQTPDFNDELQNRGLLPKKSRVKEKHTELLQVRIRPSMVDALQHLADVKDLSVSDLVRQAIRAYLATETQI